MCISSFISTSIYVSVPISLKSLWHWNKLESLPFPHFRFFKMACENSQSLASNFLLHLICSCSGPHLQPDTFYLICFYSEPICSQTHSICMNLILLSSFTSTWLYYYRKSLFRKMKWKKNVLFISEPPKFYVKNQFVLIKWVTSSQKNRSPTGFIKGAFALLRLLNRLPSLCPLTLHC